MKRSRKDIQLLEKIETKYTAKQLQLDIKRMGAIKKKLATLDPLKSEYEQIRERVLFGMVAQKSKRTDPINGWYAVRAFRADVKVINPTEVEFWLEDNDFNLDEFKTLALDRVKAVAKERLSRDGEVVPGTEYTETEYITLKEEK